MPTHSNSRKLRRFFTRQSLQQAPQDLWLEASETHHLKDIIRLREGDACLVTDGLGMEAEVVIREFSKDGRAHLQIMKVTVQPEEDAKEIHLRVFPALLRQGKTDFVVEKAQELGVHEIQPIFSEYCEVKIAQEKNIKVMERWARIAREASKQSGSLKVLKILEPGQFKDVVSSVAPNEFLVMFHPSPEAIAYPQWIEEFRSQKKNFAALNLLIGPEGGFSEDEVAWMRFKKKESQYRFVSLGKVLYKADTAFVGIIAALRFSGVLSLQ